MIDIRGSGGGGGGGKGSKQARQSEPRTPEEETDNLNSISYVKVIELLSEGEIEGLKNGLQSVFFNNTPVQNPDGSYNFEPVPQIELRYGTQDQSYIPGFDDVSNEVSVGVDVTTSSPVIRTITDTTVNAVRVSISIPALQRLDSTGDIRGTFVRLQIYTQRNGGGYSLAVDDEIAGRTADQYQRDYLVNIGGPFPVDVQVVRVTPDSDSTKLSNAFSWTSLTEITYARLKYPNSALAGLRVSAEQFSSIPQRSYLIRGIKVKIPSNATVDDSNGRLVYTGVWNGSFGAAQWTSDPAWILWDILTNSRFGAGSYIDTAELDRWSFYSASQYCSALVQDGFGGFEPRFSCNVNIQTQEEAYKVINDLCSTFRAMPFWSAGALTISQDKPAASSYLFTRANVGEEGFSYSGTSLKGRPTVAVVSYLDLNTRDIAREVVEDQAAIAKYGATTVEVSAFACTSRGQANRIGDWLLYSSQYETSTVSFTASIDAGVLVRPGQVIELSDPSRTGVRRGGRISSATSTVIVVDDATGLTATNSPMLSVLLPDGTVQAKAVASIAGSAITVSSAFSTAPNANSVWVFETSDIQTSTWRVLGIQEQDDCNYLINALSYNSSKYDYIERGAPLQARDITNLNIIPGAPENLTAQEVFYDLNGRAATKIIIDWRSVNGVNNYRVRWRAQYNNWSSVTVDASDYEILDTSDGIYEIQVASIGATLVPSAAASLTFSAAGATAVPADVTGVSLVAVDEASAILSWDASTELDVRLGGKVLIRHSPRLDTPQWSEATEIVQGASGNQVQKVVPLLEGSYLLRFQDAGRRQSANVTYVVADLPQPQPRLLVSSYAEDQETPPFSGNSVDMFYSADFDALVLSSGPLVDTFSDWDSLTTIDAPGGVLSGEVVSQGEYEFGSSWDMGGVFDVNLQRRFVTRAITQSELIDDQSQNIDDWGYIDGADATGTNALLYVRSTPDDPNGSPTWGAWREFANAIVRGRGYQFKTVATSTNPSENILIDELGVVMELQQRSQQSGTLTSGAGTYTATFDSAFYQVPVVGVTGFNMAAGDYWEINPATVSRTGFQVTFKNAGTAISRQFSFTAVGYGREIT